MATTSPNIQPRKPSITGWWWLIALLLLSIFCYTTRNVDVPITGVTVQRSDEYNIDAVDFSLNGREVISRTRGHPDTPLGSIGANVYRFTGKIVMDRASYAIDISDCKPVCAFRANDELWCIAKGYHRPSNIQLLSLSNGSASSRIPFFNAPSSVCMVRINDKDLAYYYYCWCIGMAEKYGEHGDVTRLVRQYTEDVPRWIYRPNWHEWPGRESTACSLVMGLGKRSYMELTDAFESLLDASTPTDDPQVVMSLAYAIVEIDHSHGEQIVRAFRARCGAVNDPRVVAIRDIAP